MSWKKVGGTNKLDSTNNINVNTIVADKFTLKDYFYGDMNVLGNIHTQGSISVDSNIIANYLGAENLFANTSLKVLRSATVYGNSAVKRDFYLYSRMIMGNIEGSGNILTFVNNDNSGGLIIAQAKIVDLFNGVAEEYFDGRLGFNTTTPQATIDIVGTQPLTFAIKTNTDTNYNIISRNVEETGIVTYTDLPTSSIQFYKETAIPAPTDISGANPDAKIEYVEGGDLVIDASHGLFVHSQFSVSTRPDEDDLPVLNSAMTVYDVSAGQYMYNIYGNTTATQGNAATFVTQDVSSVTSINFVNSTDSAGFSIGGGAFPPNPSQKMGTMGYLDTQGVYAPAVSMVSSQTNRLYKRITTGINTAFPKTDQYIMDINGPTIIRSGECTLMENIKFELHVMHMCRTDPNYIIAVGKPYTLHGDPDTIYTDNLTGEIFYKDYQQKIYISRDQGQHWIISDFNETDIGLFPDNYITSAFSYDASFTFVCSRKGFLYYTVDGGLIWYGIAGIPLSLNVHSIFITNTFIQSMQVFRVFVCGSMQIRWFDMPSHFYTTPDNINIAAMNNGSIDMPAGITNACHGVDAAMYVLVGPTVYVYNIGIFGNPAIMMPIHYTSPTGNTYTALSVSSQNVAMFVGNGTITYTLDAGNTFSEYTSDADQFLRGITVNSAYLKNDTHGIIVGYDASSAVFLYSNDQFSHWNRISTTTLVDAGVPHSANYSQLLYDVCMPTDTTIFVMNLIDLYDPSNNQIGQSDIFSIYLPAIFTPETNITLNVSNGRAIVDGSMNVGHDLIVGGSVTIGKDLVAHNIQLENVTTNVVSANILYANQNLVVDGSGIVYGNTRLAGLVTMNTGIKNNAGLTITTNQLGYLSSLSGDIQSLFNTKLSIDSSGATLPGNHTLSGNLTLSGALSTISGNLQANGATITPQQLGYIGSLTSNVQTQLNNKFDLYATSHTLPGTYTLTGGGIVANGNSVSTTQLGYLNTLTSNVQTQLNNKFDLNATAHTLPGTYTLTGGGIVANGNSVSTTQLGYLNTLTSNVQTQLNNRFDLNAVAYTLNGDYTYNGRLTYNNSIFVANNTEITPSTLACMNGARSNFQSQLDGFYTAIQGISGGTASIIMNTAYTDLSHNMNTFLNQNTFTNNTMFSGNILANNKTITPTQLGYLSDMTSSIKSQLDTKPTFNSNSGIDLTGGITAGGSVIATGDVSGNTLYSLYQYYGSSTTISTNTTLTATQTGSVIYVSSDISGIITLTLPTPSSRGIQFHIINSSATYGVSIATPTGTILPGATTTYTIPPLTNTSIRSDTSGWKIMTGSSGVATLKTDNAFTGKISVADTATFASTTTSYGNVGIGKLATANALDVSGIVVISGNSTIGGTLGVAGGYIGVGKSVPTGTLALDVSGGLALTRDLTVGGTALIGGPNVSIGCNISTYNLDVSGNMRTTTGATIGGGITVGSTASIGGNVGIGKTATTNALDVSGIVVISGNSTIGGTLGVAGGYMGVGKPVPTGTLALDVSGGLAVSGIAQIGGPNVSIGCDISTYNLDVSGNMRTTTGATIGGGITVGSTASIGGNVGIGKTATANALDVSGSIVSNSSLQVGSIGVNTMPSGTYKIDVSGNMRAIDMNIRNLVITNSNTVSYPLDVSGTIRAKRIEVSEGITVTGNSNSIADSQLSSNVCLLDTTQTFTGSKTFSSNTLFNNNIKVNDPPAPTGANTYSLDVSGGLRVYSGSVSFPNRSILNSALPTDISFNTLTIGTPTPLIGSDASSNYAVKISGGLRVEGLVSLPSNSITAVSLPASVCLKAGDSLYLDGPNARLGIKQSANNTRTDLDVSGNILANGIYATDRAIIGRPYSAGFPITTGAVFDVSGGIYGTKLSINCPISNTYTTDISGRLHIQNNGSNDTSLAVDGSASILNTLNIGSGQCFIDSSANIRLLTTSTNSALNYNISIGQAVNPNYVGSNNVGIGRQSLQNITSTSSDNVSIGYSAGANVGATGNTVYVGSSAGTNSVGAYNTAVGSSAYKKTTNTNMTGTYNTAIGYGSGQIVGDGSYNTFLGANAAFDSAQTGVINNSTAIGYNSKITGSNQIVIGTSNERTYIPGKITIGDTYVSNSTNVLDISGNTSLANTSISTLSVTNPITFSKTANSKILLDSSSNVSIGVSTIGSSVTGSNNIGIGATTATALTTGSNNIAMGQNSLTNITTGTNNIAMGQNSGKYIVDSTNNVIIGNGAVYNTSSTASITASTYGIVAIGQNAGSRMANGYTNNTFIGTNTDIVSSGLTAGTMITNSTAIGSGSQISASNQIMMGTSSQNVIVPGSIQQSQTSATWTINPNGDVSARQYKMTNTRGNYVISNITDASYALFNSSANSLAWYNVSIGDNALTNCNSCYNVGIGQGALYRCTTPISGTYGNNVGVGNSALTNITSGVNNTAIGYNAGQACSTSSNNNTFLGAYTDVNNASSIYTNSTAIGYNAKIDASNQIMLGTTTETVIIPNQIQNAQINASWAITNAGNISGNNISGKLMTLSNGQNNNLLKVLENNNTSKYVFVNGYGTIGYTGDNNTSIWSINNAGQVAAKKYFVTSTTTNFVLSNIDGTANVSDNSGSQQNVCIGSSCLTNCSSYWNIAIGMGVLPKFTNPSTIGDAINYGCNIGVGANAGSNLTSGNYNVIMGHNSLMNVTSGTRNVAIGATAGNKMISGGKYNTFLGSNTDFDASNSYTNSTAIGYNAKIDASNEIMLGTASETVVIPNIIQNTKPGTNSNWFINNVGSSYFTNVNIGQYVSIYNKNNGKQYIYINNDGTIGHHQETGSDLWSIDSSGNATFKSVSLKTTLNLYNPIQINNPTVSGEYTYINADGWMGRHRPNNTPDYWTISDTGAATFTSINSGAIPNLDTSKITTGTFGTDRIPNLNTSKITTGTFGTDRIPNLNASKITEGTFDVARIPATINKLMTFSNGSDNIIKAIYNTNINEYIYMNGSGRIGYWNSSVNNWYIDRTGDATFTSINSGAIPSLDTSKITTGSFVTDRIPNLDASKITTGTFGTDRIPNLDTSKITTGSFVTDRIPNLDASKITSGTFHSDRIPSTINSKTMTFSYGTNNVIQVLRDGSSTNYIFMNGQGQIGYTNGSNQWYIDSAGFVNATQYKMTNPYGNYVLSNNTTSNYPLFSSSASNTASNNICIGNNVLIACTSSYNIGIGSNALYKCSKPTTDSNGYNIGIGARTLYNIETGIKNTALGYSAGNGCSTSSNNNTFIGSNTNVSNVSSTYNNSTAIGYGATIDASNEIMLGTANETVIIPNKIQNAKTGASWSINNAGNATFNSITCNSNLTSFLNFSSDTAGVKFNRTTGYFKICAEAAGALCIYCDNAASNGVFLGYGNTSWSANSDKRIKRDIHDIEPSLEKILQINPVYFNFKSDEQSTPSRVGFIAQNIQEYFPKVVTSGSFNEEINDHILGVSPTELIPYLVKSIQEQQQQINDQQQQINDQKQQINDLKDLVNKLVTQLNK